MSNFQAFKTFDYNDGAGSATVVPDFCAAINTVGITCTGLRTILLKPPVAKGQIIDIAKDGAGILMLQPSKSEGVQGYPEGQAIYTEDVMAAISLIATDSGWQASCYPSGTWKTDVNAAPVTITF